MTKPPPTGAKIEHYYEKKTGILVGHRLSHMGVVSESELLETNMPGL